MRPLRRRRVFTPRTSVIYQQTPSESGLACLSMIMIHPGDRRKLGEIREIAPPGRDGLSLEGLEQCAKHLGYQASPETVSLDELQLRSTPVILHWNFSHYVVLENWDGIHARVIDPPRGGDEFQQKNSLTALRAYVST